MAALTQVRGGEGEPPQGRALKSQLPEFLPVARIFKGVSRSCGVFRGDAVSSHRA